LTLNPGTRLGPFEITALLGVGGMGEVYRATDTNLKRQVAIKVLPASVAGDAERVTRFQREAEVLAALNHPNIAHIHGLEKTDGGIALVMELVEGPTLADRIANGAIPIDEALPIAKQIAEALESAHDQGIIHRDLKPANIKVRNDGTVKVLDFGLAKALEPVFGRSGPDVTFTNSPTITSPAMMTGVGVLLGTAPYMSPEQAKGRPADKRSDLWAFGCVLYEMLTSRRAFGSDNVSETLAAVIKSEPAWKALPADTPENVLRLLHRCLRKDPHQRLGDAGAARLELDPPDAPALSGSASRASWREPAAWLIAIVAIVLAGAMAVVYVRRVVPEPNVMRFEVNTPPTRDPTSFALSPDGHELVFVADADGVPKLWRRPLDQTTARPLAGTDGATYPFWSPDSRAIGFFADGKLKRVDLVGGAPQVLADAPTGRGGTWNSDGVILFTPNGQVGAASILTRVSAAGGAVTPVLPLTAGQVSDRWPQFLSDGRRFLYFSGFGRSDTRGVYVGSLDGGEPKRVLATESSALYAPPGFLLFVRQDALVALPFDPERRVTSGAPALVAEPVGTDFGVARAVFSISSAGIIAHRAVGGQSRQLVWMNRAGTALGTVGPRDEANLADPELSPDGQVVVVRRNVLGNVDVWSMDTTRGVQTPFTFEHSDQGALWSHDGRRIAFVSSRNGGEWLFEKAASGAGGDQSLRVELDMPQSWSPDGRFLLYLKIDAVAGADLWALPMPPMTGEGKPYPVVKTRFDERRGQFSPDGQWVAYESNQSGPFQIYVERFPASGAKRQVSTAGGSQVRWRHDGKELFYVAADQRLMAVPIAVAADGQTLNPGEPVPLFLTHLAQGPGITETRWQYAVAPDGRFLMNTRLDETAPPITIVANWQGALGRREMR
jgi:serine/threonine protein kinase